MYKKIVKWIVLASFLIYLGLVLTIAMPRHFAFSYADAIVVLGHSIDRDNSPRNWLAARLNVAANLYNQGMAGSIIVSGGQGPTDEVAVAYVMKNRLLELGIPSDSIIVEDSASSTFQNFKYSKIIADDLGIETIVFVTNDFHIFRAMITANLFFDNTTAAVATIPPSVAHFFAVLREPFSLAKLFFDHFIFS